MRLYHEGDRGEPVRDIQDRLIALGYPIRREELGVFADATFAAVSTFQSDRGLPVDGIVGPETWRSLVDAGYRLGDRMLYHRVPMMRGDDVAELQARLNSLGFDTGKVDGIFGPNTLAGILDFQRNRGLAEDGIAGSLVAGELHLMDRATQKQGRETVRDRQWLQNLPGSVAGQRIYLDPECRTPEESEATWRIATESAREIQRLGGIPVLSRSIDTAAVPLSRARRANRLDADLVIGLFVPVDGVEGVLYFSSEHSMSEAGRAVAEVVAGRLRLETRGGTMPILKNTRAPAIAIALRNPTRRAGRILAHVVGALYEEPTLLQPEGSNR